VFWFVFIIALTMASDALGIPQVSAVLAQLVAYIPSIIAAILILILAALLANFLAGIVRGATGSDLLASVARYAIIVYAAFAALTQLGIAVQLTSNTFLILLGGVALAAALAFGIGGREIAQDVLQRAYNRSGEVTPRGAVAPRAVVVAAPPGTPLRAGTTGRLSLPTGKTTRTNGKSKSAREPGPPCRRPRSR
jgi:hypothetical protein